MTPRARGTASSASASQKVRDAVAPEDVPVPAVPGPGADALARDAVPDGWSPELIPPADPPLSGTGQSVVVLFSRAMGEVGSIAKDRQIEEGPQRYKFRGIEDVQQRLQPILTRYGLVILPRTLERIDHPVRTTRSGGSMYAVALHVQFTVYGPAGDTLVMSAWGEGADSGDKSSGKAHSMAYKTAMLEAFCVPTSEDTPDADRTVPEATFTEEQRARARVAWEAALDTTDEAALSVVRNRAVALLEVPVDYQGQTATLAERLVGRLAYLRQQATENGAGS